MENKKNKIVFAGVVLVVILFLVSYTYLVVADEEEAEPLTQPTLPEWQETESEYSSKLEALDALKEERQIVPPSAYPEHMVDEKGYFNPDYMEYEKQRLIDSIYATENFTRPEPLNEFAQTKLGTPQLVTESKSEVEEKSSRPSSTELGLEHQLFFASNPKKSDESTWVIPVEVVGKQTVKKDSRILLQTTKAITFNGTKIPRNTPIWGVVSFQPNRVLVQVVQIGKLTIAAEGFDVQDGMLGLYVENSFRAQAITELVDDVAQDINIAGVPQVRGIKSIFQRNNRNVKVTLLDGHQFILKTKTH